MDLRQLESRRVQTIVDLFHKAARRTPSDKARWKPEGKGKSAHEILEHVVGANHAFAALIRRDRPPSGSEDRQRQQVKAPTADYDQALEALRASGRELAEAIASVPDDQLKGERRMFWGETWAVTRVITAPSAHIAYHWGQLCYLQTLWGDREDYY